MPGGYGEGDLLLGIRVPEQRKIARRHREAPLEDLERLLASDIHERRFVALAILRYSLERLPAEDRRAYMAR